VTLRIIWPTLLRAVRRRSYEFAASAQNNDQKITQDNFQINIFEIMEVTHRVWRFDTIL
jgi:hypothetical protein